MALLFFAPAIFNNSNPKSLTCAGSAGDAYSRVGGKSSPRTVSGKQVMVDNEAKMIVSDAIFFMSMLMLPIRG